MKALQRFGDAASIEDLRQRVQREFDYLYTQLSQLENKAPARTIGAPTGSGLWVATSSGGAATRELKKRTITFSDNTTLDVIVPDP